MQNFSFLLLAATRSLKKEEYPVHEDRSWEKEAQLSHWVYPPEQDERISNEHCSAHNRTDTFSALQISGGSTVRNFPSQLSCIRNTIPNSFTQKRKEKNFGDCIRAWAETDILTDGIAVDVEQIFGFCDAFSIQTPGVKLKCFLFGETNI